MNRTKYIIVSSIIALIVLVGITCLIEHNANKKYIDIAVLNRDIKEGQTISISDIIWVKMDTTKLDINNYITEQNFIDCKGYVLNSWQPKGQVIYNKSLISREEYLEKIAGMEYVALPIKSATEGVCYKIKKGDIVSVYYTAKKKLVDSILNDKKRVYSVATNETLVTCVLYEDIEIMALTNNIGQDSSGHDITDVVVRLTQEEVLELANLKEQGTFTLTIK